MISLLIIFVIALVHSTNILNPNIERSKQRGIKSDEDDISYHDRRENTNENQRRMNLEVKEDELEDDLLEINDDDKSSGKLSWFQKEREDRKRRVKTRRKRKYNRGIEPDLTITNKELLEFKSPSNWFTAYPWIAYPTTAIGGIATLAIFCIVFIVVSACFMYFVDKCLPDRIRKIFRLGKKKNVVRGSLEGRIGTM